MLETPQERVKLLKAGVDGKTIEKLYLTHNSFKVVNSPILFNLDKMHVHPSTTVRKAIKSDVCWSVKIFSLAYVDGVSSIILRSIFPDYSTLIILVASSILIYFMIRTIRMTDWRSLLFVPVKVRSLASWVYKGISSPIK